MQKCYNSDEPSEWTKENEITDIVEKGLHRAFKEVLQSSVLREKFSEHVGEDPDLSIEGWEDLSDYGNIQFIVREKKAKQ